MIIRKTAEQISGIREAGRIVAEAIAAMGEIAKAGITTAQLDKKAREVFEKNGARSAFLGYRPSRSMPAFPGFICISINDEIVHGIPNSRTVIKPGDLVSIDVGSRYRGFVGDAAATYVIEGATPEARVLAWETYRALHRGLANAKPHGKLEQISSTVQNHAESKGFSVVREFVGHGVGLQLHEEPQVPNFVDNSSPDVILEPGMTIAVEPMICEKRYKTVTDPDGWTVRTADGGLAAHFEHSIAITNDGMEILTLLADGTEPYVPPEP